MTRTQIQLPGPLFGRLKRIAQVRDVSLAEVIRRGMELYAQSCTDAAPAAEGWTMPVLRGSGGHLVDPSTRSAEAEAIDLRAGIR